MKKSKHINTWHELYTSAKFKVDDIVCMIDDTHFNPVNATLSIGKVLSVHLRAGTDMFLDSRTKKPCPISKIVYTVSGFSLMPKENQLSLLSDFERTKTL